MSTELGPYQAEVAAFTCEDCPLRRLTESELADMAEGEEPYYLASTFDEARQIANGEMGRGEPGVIPAMYHVYAGLPFPLDPLHEPLRVASAGQLEGGDDRVEYQWDGAGLYADMTIPDVAFPIQPKALLGCLRRAKAGACHPQQITAPEESNEY